jgi:hypothetical protein
MKKKRLLLLGMVLIFAILVVSVSAAAPAVKRGRGGTWCYRGTDPNPEGFTFGYEIGEHDFFTGSYDSYWTGAFNGVSVDNGLVVWRNFELPPPAEGPAMFVDLITFESVEVGGKTGGLELYLYGERETDFWSGSLFIVGASGELEGLEGRGRWWQWKGDPEGVCEDGFIPVRYRVYKLRSVDFHGEK